MVSDDQSSRGKRPLLHVANTERRIAFKEVELREKGSSQKMSEASSHERSGTSSSKKRRPQTLEQLVGNEAPGEASSRTRGSGRGRSGRKSKGKQRADAQLAADEEESVDAPQAILDSMDTSEG